MTSAHILDPASYITMPWKNGLGSTVEIIKKHIPGSEDFAWRISMADVTTNGPFSYFENYDRTLLLLKGNGISLSIKKPDKNRAEMLTLTKILQAAQFRGEDLTVAALHSGPITDFNVMSHRDYCDVDTVCGHEAEQTRIAMECDEALIYCVTGNLSIDSDSGRNWVLAEKFTLHITKPAEQSFIFTGGKFIAIQVRNKITD